MTPMSRPSAAATSAAASEVCTDGPYETIVASRPSRSTADECNGRQRSPGREVDLGLLPVAPLGLEEDDRVVARDGLLDHAERVGRAAAGDHLQAGGVGEVRLGTLAVMLDRADAATERNPNGDRHFHGSAAAVVQLRELAHDLVEGRVDEAVELDLADRPVAAHGKADGGADDAGLGERGVDHALLAEVLLQPVGDPEDAAELADVLTHHQHPLVGSPWRGAGPR